MPPRALAAVAVATLALTGVPAHAANGHAYVMTGVASFTPGLGALPQSQPFSISGTATRPTITPLGLATSPCDFVGVDLVGSVALGAGSMSGGCGTSGYTSITFVRAGIHLTAVGTNGLGTAIHLDCVLVPSGVPTTSASITCDVQDA